MNSDQKEVRPLVSVIIPVYKVEAYIRQCLKSVVGQTYQYLEVILVDDCGGDKSIAMAEEVLSGATLPWKTLQHKHNRGLSAARNTGVQEANGQYLFFLDSDDYLSTNAIELLVEKAISGKADMVYGNLAYDTEGVITRGFWALKANYDSRQMSPLQAHCTRTIYPMAWNRLICTEFYRKSGVGFIEGIYHEDEPWSFSLILRAKKIALVHEVTYYYRQRSGAISAEKHNTFPKLNGFFKGFKAIAEEATAHGVSTNEDFCTWFQTNLHNYLRRLQGGAATAKQKDELLRKLFTEISLTYTVLKRGFLFRLMRVLSPLLPYRIWALLYLQVRETKENAGREFFILWGWWLGALMGGLCLLASESLAEQWYKGENTISPLWQGVRMLCCGVMCLWVSIHCKRRFLNQRKILPSCISALLISAGIVCSLFGNVLMDIPTVPGDSQVGYNCVLVGLSCLLIWFLLSLFKRK